MITEAKEFLSSEIHELEDLLQKLPESRVLDRLSLNARLNRAKALLEKEPLVKAPPRLQLTFRGKPVFKSQSIASNFGAKAMEAFADAFALLAAGQTEYLEDKGPIPHKHLNQLRITGTATGSFGFEFELPQTLESDTKENPIAEHAIRQMEALLRTTAEESDDEVAEAVADLQPRAIRKVNDFLKLLLQEEAWCGLQFGKRQFRYTNLEQLERSFKRLNEDNIKIREIELAGKFLGVLPASGVFEFLAENPRELIRGKLAPGFDDPDALNQDWLNKPVAVTFISKTIGSGKPRYTLRSLGDLREG